MAASKKTTAETVAGAVKSPISFKEFAKEPVKGLMFICIIAVGYLYVDIKMSNSSMQKAQNEKIEKLEEILVLGDKSGSKIYEGYIKNKKIGNVNESIYRTYNLSGVKQVEEVNIDKEYIKKFITLIKK